MPFSRPNEYECGNRTWMNAALLGLHPPRDKRHPNLFYFCRFESFISK